MATLKMIVGLGNPGPQYVANRHNIGFQCVDLFARRHQIELGKLQLQARIGEGWVTRGGERQKVLLVKPLTYMNASGQAVGPLARYYRVDLADIIVVHDDIDLASGKLRLRTGGGSGGQNGVKSLIQHLGSPEFARIRIGIGRPPGWMDPAAYVLQNFSADEEAVFGPLRLRVCDALTCWLFDGMAAAMNLYNRAADNSRDPVVEASANPAADLA
ncbi:MAG: aminoacyl-tRNA hydrolase [Chloroflexi bacterium]|nr:MAG: aminoacyl-tRNA hydrolase [Chloroflexota bacterium]